MSKTTLADARPHNTPPPDNGLPFGAQERCARGPVLIFVLLLAAWFGFLVWMAILVVGR